MKEKVMLSRLSGISSSGQGCFRTYKLIYKPLFIILSVFFCLSSTKLTANSNRIDSLLKQLSVSKQDTNRVTILTNLCWLYSSSNPEKALEYAKEGLALAAKLHYKKGLALIRHNFGAVYYHQAKYDKAVKQFLQSIRTLEEIDTKDSTDWLFREKTIIKNINHLGNICQIQGLHDKTLKYYLDGLKRRERINEQYPNDLDNNIGLTTNLELIGNTYKILLRDTHKAMQYYSEAYKISKEIEKQHPEENGNLYRIATLISNMGAIYLEESNYEKSIEHFNLSSEYIKKIKNVNRFADIGNIILLAGNMYSMGEVYIRMADQQQDISLYNKAIEYAQKSCDLFKDVHYEGGIATTLVKFGRAYLGLKNYQKAKEYFEQCIFMAEKVKYRELVLESYDYLIQTNVLQNNFSEAYTYQKKYIVLKDSIYNEKSSKQIAEMQTKYESEKKEKEIELLNKEKALQQTKLNKNKIVTYAILGGSVLLLIVIVVIFRNYRIKKQANEQLQKQNIQITNQKEIIEEKNKDIMDSIRYAKRIQNAILPSNEVIQKHFPNSFVLYKPKDIVSGDFYWMEVANCQLPTVMFAVVDCTGHGVPGAFMSIVGENGLKRTVRELGICQPSLILDHLNQYVEETFSKSEGDVKDGMDIALCSVEFPVHSSELEGKNRKQEALNTKLQFAGANNSLYLIRNNELTEIKGDKQPIGQHIGRKSFTNHSFELQKGDTIYLSSDGIADQFGGEKGKKFKYKLLKELLLFINNKTIEEQKNSIEQTIEQWRGKMEQVDDICIMGIRV